MPDLFTVTTPDVTLHGEDSGGDGPAVVLAHGLTATRRYVVMGSTALARAGHRVISYDARGHGESSAAARYDYRALAADLVCVMDDRGVDRAVLAGASMGAHTLVRCALESSERVAGLVVITPAYDGELGSTGRWDRLSAGLRAGGIDGFVDAYDFSAVAPDLRATVETVIRQRMGRHENLSAVADALEQVPRSAPFGSLSELAAISGPAAVIASGDEADPEHPQAVGEAYAQVIPGARLVLDEPGRSPVAWQGSQVSRVIAEVAANAF